MRSHVIRMARVLARAAHGPLGPHLAVFEDWARQRGYAVSTRYDQVRLASGFSRWLGAHAIALPRLTRAHVVRYLRYRTRHGRPHRSDGAVLRRVLEVLAERGVVDREPPVAPRSTPVERCVQGFLRYLHEERGLTPETTVSYARWVRRFLSDRFAHRVFRLDRLTAPDVIAFVRRSVPRLHQREAKMLATALRSFLRYGWYRSLMARDLASVVPTVPHWSVTSIARAIAPDQVRRLLRSVARDTTPGRRDYAILLLLARLGLRAGEIAGLQLEDIDWHGGRLHLRRKGGRTMDLPLSAEVGRALAEYVRDGRPCSADRHVFLRLRAPHRRGCRAIVGSVVRRALRRAGIVAPTSGAHQFRHGLATALLQHGASLPEIAEVLGHRSVDSTKLYAHLDVRALRTIALPWPGGAR